MPPARSRTGASRSCSPATRRTPACRSPFRAAPMLELARSSDAALSFEAAVDGTATIGRRGINSWTLEMTGETGHSSGIFGAGTRQRCGLRGGPDPGRIPGRARRREVPHDQSQRDRRRHEGGARRLSRHGRGQDQRDRADRRRPRRHPLHQPRTGALGASSACRRSWRGTCRARVRRCASTTGPIRR